MFSFLEALLFEVEVFVAFDQSFGRAATTATSVSANIVFKFMFAIYEKAAQRKGEVNQEIDHFKILNHEFDFALLPPPRPWSNCTDRL